MKTFFRQHEARSGATNNSRIGRSRGQVMVLVGVGLVVLLAMAGLAVDVGLLWATDHQMRAATDAAAKAAAEEILSGNAATVQSAGQNDASINGFTAGGPNKVTVTINNPPKGGPYKGDSKYAEAIISQTVPTYFLRVLSIKSVPMTTRATATILSSPVCVWMNDPSSARHVLTIGQGNNAAVLNGPTCAIMVDSDSVDPISTHSGGCTNMKSITIVGGFIDDGDCVQPTPKTGQLPVTDPLAYVQEPVAGGCDFGTGTTPMKITTNTTLSQGTYCGGIQISGSVTVHFNPGTYILKGGGMKATLNAATGLPASSGSCGTDQCPTTPVCAATGPNLQGTGVTFYNTGVMGGKAGVSTTFTQINIQASTSTSLSPPTSGATEGILFMEDRSAPITTTNEIACGSYTGTFYFPNSELSFGGTGSPPYNNFLAYDMRFGSSYTIGDNYSSLSDGSPFKIGASLAE